MSIQHQGSGCVVLFSSFKTNSLSIGSCYLLCLTFNGQHYLPSKGRPFTLWHYQQCSPHPLNIGVDTKYKKGYINLSFEINCNHWTC